MKSPILFLVGAVALSIGTRAAEPVAELETLMTERGKLVLKEDFDQPPGRQWRLAEPVWETVDGALKATHRKPFPANHGPVMQHTVALKDAIVQLAFKLEGNSRATLHFNKANGHLCRVLLRADAFYVIRRDSGGDKGIQLDSRQTPIAPDHWHTLVFETCGPEMLASLDGKEVIFGARDDLAQEKRALILEGAAGTVWFKNLRLWEALPNKDWETTKAKLLTARKVSVPVK